MPLLIEQDKGIRPPAPNPKNVSPGVSPGAALERDTLQWAHILRHWERRQRLHALTHFWGGFAIAAVAILGATWVLFWIRDHGLFMSDRLENPDAWSPGFSQI